MADNKRTRKYDNLHKNPDYAVVCSFLGKFNSLLNSPDITFENLERWISEQRPICNTFKDFLLSLLKRWRSSANDERFSKYLLKFCESYSLSDAAELEKFGFEKCSMDLKLRLVKNLVEQQFDTNIKFKDKVNMISADELRVQPIGRDIQGRTYWSFMDCDMNLRIFSGEAPAAATDFKRKWEVMARNRMELSELISSLRNSDLTIEKLSSNNNNGNQSDSDEEEQKLDAELKINVQGDDNMNDIKAESIKEDVSVKKEIDETTIDRVENKSIVPVSSAPTDNGEADNNTGNHDTDKDMSTTYYEINGKDRNHAEKNETSPQTREEPLVEFSKDENAIVSPVLDSENGCDNVDIDDGNVDMSQKISDDHASHLVEVKATCIYSNVDVKDLEEPPDDCNKILDCGKNELDETVAKGSDDVVCNVNLTASTSNEPEDLQVSSLDIVGTIHKQENADQKKDSESLLEEESAVTEVAKSCEVVKPVVNMSEGSDSSVEFGGHKGENSSTHGDTKPRDNSSLDGLSIGFVEPAIPTTSSKCSGRRFRILTKRKRDFVSSDRSNFLHGRRKGISDSELSESSLDSNPEDSGAQSSAPEDGPPLKRQRNKALINRSRRNVLHCQLFRVKDQYTPERLPENSVAIHSSLEVATPSGDTLLNGVQHSGVDDAKCKKENCSEDSMVEKEGIKEENNSKECPIQGQQEIEVHDSSSKISESTQEVVGTNIAILATNQTKDEPSGDKEVREELVLVNNPSSLQDEKNANSDADLNGSITQSHAMEETQASQSQACEISTTEENKDAHEFGEREEPKTESEASPETKENVEPVLPISLNDQIPSSCPANQENSQENIDGKKLINVDKKDTQSSPEEEEGHEKMTDLSVKCATKRPPDSGFKRLEDADQSVDKDEISSDSSEHAPKKRCSDFDHPSITLGQTEAEISGQGQKDESVFPSNDKRIETVPNEGSDENKNSNDPETTLPSNSHTSNSSEKGETKTETSGNSQELPEDEDKAGESKKKSKKVNGCSEDGSTDFVELRRSSRVNKGQRKVEMLELEFPSRRRKKKEEMTEEEREKKQAEKEKRRTEKMMRQMAEEYEELLQAKKDKKKRFKLINDDDDDDEDFIPGMRRSLRGKRKKRNDDDDDDEDDDSFSDVDDDCDDHTLGTQSSTSDEELLILESDGSVYEPTGRNARRVASLKSELESESKYQITLVDQQCLVCDKRSEPEFMLLCDKCDDGYHTCCLRPPLHVIPDGDWFCPPCEHKMLLERLQEQLCEFDEKAKLNVKLTNRKERLAFVNISLNNILMEKDMEELSEKLQETQSRHLASSSSDGDDDNDDRDNDRCSGNDEDFCDLQNGGKKSKVRGKKLLSTDSEESVAVCNLKADDKDDDDDEEGGNLIQNKKPKKRNRLTSSSENDSLTDFHDEDEDDDDDDDDVLDKLPKKKKTKSRRKSEDDDDDDASNDEISNKKKTKKRRFYTSDEDDGDDDEEDEVEGNWLVTRRSRRQRKEISYKFEEYENLISGAIEDDVKETYGAGNYGRGKDMANITGAKNNSSNSPAGNGKRRRKKKKFSVLDSDDEGGDNDDDDDDSEEFKIDDDDASVDEDDEEEDAATEIDQSEIDEGEVESGRGCKGKLVDSSSRKSKRNKKRSRAYDDYVIEEDLMLDAKALKRPPVRRAAARKGINYNEYTDDDNDDESSAKRHKNSEDSKKESPSSVKCNPSLRGGKSRKKRSRDEDGDEDYLEDEDDEYEEEDFTPGCRDSYSDDDLRDFIKSGSSTTSECSSSPSRKANKKNRSLTKSQKKKKVAPSSSSGGNKRRRKLAGGNNSCSNKNKKKGKKTKKKKRKPWYSSDSDEVDEEEASVTRDSYSDDDFVSYTITAPQKRTGRRALTYKDEQENPAEKPLESVPVSSADVSVQSSMPPLTKGVAVEAHLPANQPEVANSSQPISTAPQVTASAQKIVSPIPQVTVANQRLNSPCPLTTLTGQRITSPHALQVSAIGQRVASPNFQITPASMVQTVVTAASILGSSVPRFAVRESQAADLSCSVPLPALQAITTQRVSSFNPHIAAGGQRLISQDPFTFSAAAIHHFPGASTTTMSDPRGIPPLPPLYPIIKNNYLINAPVAMAMRSGMTSFGGICSIVPPPLSQGQKMAEEQVMVNHPFNEKLSSFSVRNITSVAPRNFKPPYGMGLQNAPMEEDFLVQDLDITEFLNPDHANL